MSATPKFITTCTEDEEGNLILNFPDEILDALAWKEGTELEFDIVGLGLVIREVRRADSEETGGVDEGE